MTRIPIPKFILRFFAKRKQYRQCLEAVMEAGKPEAMPGIKVSNNARRLGIPLDEVTLDDLRNVRRNREEGSNSRSWIKPRAFHSRWGRR